MAENETQREWLTEPLRRRVLGSIGEADDAVQETQLRISSETPDEIETRRSADPANSRCLLTVQRGIRERCH
jgi:hypothetical protein